MPIVVRRRAASASSPAMTTVPGAPTSCSPWTRRGQRGLPAPAGTGASRSPDAAVDVAVRPGGDPTGCPSPRDGTRSRAGAAHAPAPGRRAGTRPSHGRDPSSPTTSGAPAALRVPARDVAPPGDDAPRGEPRRAGPRRGHRPPGRPPRAAAPAHAGRRRDLAELPGSRRTTAHRIGGGVTSASCCSPLVEARLPALRAAARDFADFLTRNKATLGGNLANASPGADLVVPLLALDAAVVLAGADRRADASRWTRSSWGLAARPSGPASWSARSSCPGRGPPGLVQARAEAGRRDRRRERRHVGSRSIRPAASRTRGSRSARWGRGRSARARRRPTWSARPSTPSRVARAAELAAAAARPITDVRGGADYRTAMVRALVARCLGPAEGG